MKRYISTLCTILACAILVTSCLKDDDSSNTQYYNETAIVTFKLATVNRYVHTTSSTGADSVYKVTLSDPVVFTIDQTQRKIYNTDSLNSDVDLNHVLATVSSKNSGTVVINYPDAEGNDSLLYYNSTDSIDFEKLRDLRVYAQDGSAYRSYQVTINIHQAKTGVLLWEQKSAEDMPVDTQKSMWKQMAETAGMKQLIGYGTAEGYAFANDGILMVSKDNGETWTADNLDEDAAWLPTSNFAFTSWPFAANDSTDYQLLVGSNDNQSEGCVVWRKIAEYSKRSLPSKWVLVPIEDHNHYYLPKMENLNLVYFNGQVLAIGNDKKIYVSRDQGITWKTNSKYTLPDELGTSNVTATTDKDGYLWLVGKDTGEVWRGLIIE
jgi:hypothetical protein